MDNRRANNPVSNYDQTQRAAEAAFLAYDQRAMIARFGLGQDGEYLYVTMLNRRYRVDRRRGQVSWRAGETWHPAGFSEAMTIFDVLTGPGGRLAGEWVHIDSLSAIHGGSLAGARRLFEPSAAAFAGRTAALAAACEALGGHPFVEGAKGAHIAGSGLPARGDVACVLELFPFLPLALQFYDADDEFPASLQLYTDRNVLQFLHYETLMYALGHVMQRLGEEGITSP